MDESVPRLGVDMVDRAKLSVELANVAIALGELQATTDPGAARLAWKRAETLLAPFESLPDGSVLTPLAQTYYYLGNIQRAEALIAQIQQTSYRHPAYVGLVKKLQAERGGGRNIEISGMNHEKK